MAQFRGTYAVIVTPFTKSDSLDEAGLKANLDWLISEGVKGIVCYGSTGEFPDLEDSERERLFQLTVEHVNGRVPVLAGTTAHSTKEAIRVTALAKSIGADGIQITHPYYCQPNQEEMYEHYKAIATTVEIPMMIYNQPRTTGVDMRPEWLVRAAELPNIDYVKESTGDVTRVREIIWQSKGQMTVFCGWDEIPYESFLMGAEGWISAVANVIPRWSQRLFELAVDEHDDVAAKELYQRILPLCSLLERSGKLIQYAKKGLELQGLAGGPVRRPRLPLTRAEEQSFERLLADLGVLQAHAAAPSA
jgi:4-hydroxy-tetrahydrodipicolinate synthase